MPPVKIQALDGEYVVPAMCGRVGPCRWAAVLGALSFNVQPIAYFGGGYEFFQINPQLSSGAAAMMYYTNAGTLPTNFTLEGFYFTGKMPMR
jgi:hypothetical protein